jgi:hypothetical protein
MTLLLREPPAAAPAPTPTVETATAAPEIALPALEPAPEVAPAPPAPPVPASALDIRVAPRGAQVRVNGIEVTADGGRVVREVPAGRYEVEVSAAGYTPYHRTLDVAGSTIVLDVTLRPAKRGSTRDRKKTTPGLNPDGTIDPFQ